MIRTQYQYKIWSNSHSDWGLLKTFGVICSLIQEKRGPKAYQYEALSYKLLTYRTILVECSVQTMQRKT
jgi:hypothetical protein